MLPVLVTQVLVFGPVDRGAGLKEPVFSQFSLPVPSPPTLRDFRLRLRVDLIFYRFHFLWKHLSSFSSFLRSPWESFLVASWAGAFTAETVIWLSWDFQRE